MLLHAVLDVIPRPLQPREVADTRDWEIYELATGISLPDDYKAYLSVYGTGIIGELSRHTIHSVDVPRGSQTIPVVIGYRRRWQFKSSSESSVKQFFPMLCIPRRVGFCHGEVLTMEIVYSG
jgi:hypothetical protein